MNKVAAVVVTYNRKKLLAQCLEHLADQSVPCDVLVVDNASTDGTGALVGEERFSAVQYRRMPQNLGGAGGFCEGMRWAVQAGYEGVWVMDDDTLPEPGALEALLAADRQLQKNYGFLSSRALWTDGTDCPMNLQRKTPYRDIRGFDRPLVPVTMASFVSLFVRAETVRRFGLPIAEFFIWSDDWEYTRRLSRQLPCYAVRDSRVVHAMKSRTVANIATDAPERLARYRCFYRNDVVLYRREGLKGWLWLLAKDTWHSVQVVLKSRGQKAEKLRIIWGGFRQGRRFLKDRSEVARIE